MRVSSIVTEKATAAEKASEDALESSKEYRVAYMELLNSRREELLERVRVLLSGDGLAAVLERVLRLG